MPGHENIKRKKKTRWRWNALLHKPVKWIPVLVVEYTEIFIFEGDWIKRREISTRNLNND